MAKHGHIKRAKHDRQVAELEGQLAEARLRVEELEERYENLDSVDRDLITQAETWTERAERRAERAEAEVDRLLAALRTIDRVTVTAARTRGATDAVLHGIYRNAYNRVRGIARVALGKD